MSKIFLISLLILFVIAGCATSHLYLLQYPQNWDQRKVVFKNMYFVIPDNPAWYPESIDDESQFMVFASPDFQRVEGHNISYKDTGKKALVLEAKAGFKHPDENKIMRAKMHLRAMLIPKSLEGLSDDEYLKAYIDEDWQWMGDNGLINEGAKIEYVELNVDSGLNYSGYQVLNAGEPFANVTQFCHVFHNDTDRFIIEVKLHSNDIREEDIDYIGKMLQSAKVF